MTVNPRYLRDFYTSFPQDRRHLVEFCLYPGAEHLIEPQYAPNARSVITNSTVKGFTGNVITDLFVTWFEARLFDECIRLGTRP